MIKKMTTATLAAVTALAAIAGCGAGNSSTTPAPPDQKADVVGDYMPINGLQMYYEIHGPDTGRPLVLLHGSMSGIEVDFGELIPILAQNRRVIAMEQQGQGHTADIDRPLRVEHMAADTMALLEQLGVQQADVLGYSTGAEVALQMALDRPQLVSKLVLVTPAYDNTAWHPGLMQTLQGLRPEMLHGSPFYEYYMANAPRPEDFPLLMEKNKDLQLHYPDHPVSAVQALTSPTLLVVGDSDIVRLEHAVEFFRLLGGGKNGDLEGLPASQLVVLPGTTHLTSIHRPELHTIIPEFLDAPQAG